MERVFRSSGGALLAIDDGRLRRPVGAVGGIRRRPMDNHTIARCLDEIADILDIKGENFFRVRSYRMAAESVANAGEDLAGRVKRGEGVQHLAGIGTSMAEKIREIVETGTCAY